MKKIVLFLTAFLMLNLLGNAQNNVQLNINHKLSQVTFQFNDGAKNNMDHSFYASRLEYYISEISIIHDGGIETPVTGKYILVDASQSTEVDLGDFDVTEVEGINFHIGVDEAANHSDPASYSADHPLAPKFPSMHWGWAAGYRFIAYEGMGGATFNQLFQLHGLGDDNYFKTEISLAASANNGEVVINLDADYTRGLENVAVNSGPIVHGDYGDAKKALENFRDFVFSPSSETTSTIDFREVTRFEVFPNPAFNGTANLLLNADKDLNYEVSITDVLGRQIQRIEVMSSNSIIELEVPKQGMYFINLIKEGQPVISKKLISK